MSEVHNVLITAASGNIGTPLVRQLLASKPAVPYRLVLPSRNSSKLLSKLSFPDAGTESIIVTPEGDISDPHFLEEIVRKYSVQTVFLNLTTTSELFVTLNTFDILARSGTVSHLVYLSAAGDFSPQAVLDGALDYVNAAHVAVKFITEQKLAHSKFPFTSTVLGPNLFFTNDLRSKKTMLQDKNPFFDAPLPEIGVSRVDPNDIALAALKGIEDGGKKWAGKKINIGSKQLYTATDTGRFWGEALGRDIQMQPNNWEYLKKFEKMFGEQSGHPSCVNRDHALMYDDFYKRPFYVYSDKAYQEQVEFLGKEPNDYEQWVKNKGAEIRQSM